MHRSQGGRLRTALTGVAALALTLLATGPAHAAGGTSTTPTELFNEYQGCSTDPNAPVYLAGRAGLMVEGIPGDTDTTVSTLSTRYQVWPVADPSQVTTTSNTWALSGDEATATFPAGAFSDGQTYAWQAQTVDPATGLASAWSAPCYVADDDTAPANAPTVDSPNYPQGQANQGGAPIQFTFGANGVSDVAGYEFSWTGDFPVPVASIGAHGIPSWQDPYDDPKFFVRADTLGGSGAVSLVPPQGGGFYVLTVASLDRAFNQSPTTRYFVWIKPNAPTVTQLSGNPVYGKQASFKLTPDPKLQAASPVVSYTVVHLNWQGQTTTTVKASADGTAEVPITLDGAYEDTLLVSTTSADGWISEQQWWSNGYVDTSPTVSSDVYVENGSSGGVGVPATFTFAPKVKGVANYTYAFDWGQGSTVKADGQGNAQITWTPTRSGWYDLTVYATTKDGVQLAEYDYFFTVN